MNIQKRLDRAALMQIIVDHYKTLGLDIADASIKLQRDGEGWSDDPDDFAVHLDGWLVLKDGSRA